MFRSIGVVSLVLWTLGMPAIAQQPPESPAGSTGGGSGAYGNLADVVPCDQCDSPECSGQCLVDARHGLFKLGQPDQVVPPPSGWTVIAPALPYLPRADAVPKAGPPMPWKPLFFANDFGYVDDPESPYRNTFDLWKRVHFPGDRIVHEFGGEFRWQGRIEDNRRLTGEQNNFNLFRERLYLNSWFFDRFRTYWEVYWADGSEQTVPPVFTDVDHGDVLNAFGELRLIRDESDKGWWSFRYAWREELLFGNQRLVSPLDWANARRTFDLMPHLLYRGKDWAVDAFWSRPNIILPRALNQPNYDMQFFGSYLTYLGRRNRIYDVYYLGALANEFNTVVFNGERGALQVHTLGARWQGTEDNWLWEGEAAYQFGRHTDQSTGREVDRAAGMVTAGLGHRFPEMPFVPELWFYFDYASGDPRPGVGGYGTFNQLYPLGHKYFGYMDIVGRQNILDPNVNLKLNFGKRANLLFWYHNFHLVSARDALHNAAGTPIRRDPLGTAGRYVGNELDIVFNFIVNPNADWQIGVCQFWSGPFVERTAKTPAEAANGNFFYTQFTFRF